MACTTASGFWTQDRYPVAGEDSLVGRRPVPLKKEDTTVVMICGFCSREVELGCGRNRSWTRNLHRILNKP